jgi:hypothetical protein
MYAKAIAAFVTPLIVTLLIPLGIDGDSTVTQFIEAIIMAVSTAAMVYWVPNKVQ